MILGNFSILPLLVALVSEKSTNFQRLSSKHRQISLKDLGTHSTIFIQKVLKEININNLQQEERIQISFATRRKNWPSIPKIKTVSHNWKIRLKKDEFSNKNPVGCIYNTGKLCLKFLQGNQHKRIVKREMKPTTIISYCYL